MPLQPPDNGCKSSEVSDNKLRCWWCGDDPLYLAYHDQEWGRPVANDDRLFEKISLEGFQAGLSWLTILRKRPAFRKAFYDFDFQRVARMRQATVERLVANAAIIRHRGKIESTINNARRAREMVAKQGSLAAFFWNFQPDARVPLEHIRNLPAKTPESTAMSKELKRRGWSFVGPTTCYAFMQAMGMVNDHFVSCSQWDQVDSLQRGFDWNAAPDSEV